MSGAKPCCQSDQYGTHERVAKKLQLWTTSVNARGLSTIQQTQYQSCDMCLHHAHGNDLTASFGMKRRRGVDESTSAFVASPLMNSRNRCPRYCFMQAHSAHCHPVSLTRFHGCHSLQPLSYCIRLHVHGRDIGTGSIINSSVCCTNFARNLHCRRTVLPS